MTPSRRLRAPEVRWRTAVLWPLILLPFALYAVTLPRFGALPRNDYWWNFSDVLDGDHLVRDPARWLQVRSNEHRIALPLLIWTANLHLTHGDNRGLSLVSFGLLLGTFACLWRFLPAALRASPLGRLGFGLPIAALVATPVAAHCWALGFSGTQWFLANLSAVGAIACFARWRPDADWRALLPAILVSLLGVFSHSTHLALWPALFLGTLLVATPRRASALCAASTALLIGLFAWGYTRPPRHPNPGGDPAPLLDFAVNYLSLDAAEAPAAARLWGLASLVLFGLAFGLVLRRPREQRPALVPWLLVAVYAGLNAGVTSLARAGLGLETARASRYASLPALFWLGTLAILGLAAWESPEPRRRRAGLAAVGAITIALLVCTIASGLTTLRQLLRTIERQPLGALAVLWEVDDDPVVRSTVTIGPSATRTYRPFFERAGQIPFDRAAAWPLDRPWTGPLRRAGRALSGGWQVAQPGFGRFLAVAGIAETPTGRAERVIFLDAGGIERGAAVFVPRPGAPGFSLLHAREHVATWSGYVETICPPGIQPYLEIDEGGTRVLRPLPVAPEVRGALAASCGPG